MQRVLVVDKSREPLMPCHPARARNLLKAGKAAVLRREPFTIVLKERKGGNTQSVRCKVDPGSKVSGLALVAETGQGYRMIWAAELHHRGERIKKALSDRRALRRARRTRKVRYRKPRFSNRGSEKSWLAPSLRSRVENVATWVGRLSRFAPVCSLSIEVAKFDSQKLMNPEISGVEYQRGELFGYEVWEYLLEKWERGCAYCGAENVSREKEHVVPKSRGGSDRVSNLILSCRKCNQKKANRTAQEFGYPEVQQRAGQSLKDAAAVNATRWAIYRRLSATGLPVEVSSGGRTKYNRSRLGVPKTHWTDAACVGESGEAVRVDPHHVPLIIYARGHGKRRSCGTDGYGFPFRHAPRRKSYLGFSTGDLVRAEIPFGKHAGIHTGRIAIRFRPSFKLGRIDVHPKHLSLLQKADGYECAASPVAFRRPPPPLALWWIEARANELGPEDLHPQLLRELEVPGPTREEREAP